MIRHAEYLLWSEALKSSFPHASESLWRCNLMTVEPVDVKLCGTVVNNLNDVLIPDFVEKCVHIKILITF